MNSKVATVVNGYLHLDESEKLEFLQQISEHTKGDEAVRRSCERTVTRIIAEANSGPTKPVCACCGR